MTPLPPKQGLKLPLLPHPHSPRQGYDTTSTKTRIETQFRTARFSSGGQGVMTPLPPKQGLKRSASFSALKKSIGYDTTSTKTRIETMRKWKISEGHYPVMTPLPPKQGLKLNRLAYVQ